MTEETNTRPSAVHENDRVWALEQAVGWAKQAGDQQALGYLQTMLYEARETARSGAIWA